MKLNLSGKLALVTGSNAGIGRGIAKALAACGADVVITYLNNREQGEEAAIEISGMGVRSKAFQLDATNLDSIVRLVQEVRDTFGQPVDILVNNAGHLIGRVANLEMTEEHYYKVMDVNLKSTVFMCKYFGKAMVAQGNGCIINMASLAAHNGGGPGAAVYAASKAAVIAYTKGLAKELAASGVRVNAISPGFIGQTAFHATFTSEEARKAAIAGIPLGREGTPDDVAGAVVFLASDLGKYLTGETIEVNGGQYMR